MASPRATAIRRLAPVGTLAAALGGAFVPGPARADVVLPAEARADRVSLEPRSQVMELDGNVRVESPPFYLRSDHVRLRRTRFGVEVVGDGQVAFCPCLGTPLALRFREATLAPPGDVFLTGATLRLFGVPVAYTPWFWLRSSDRAGLLPPDLALRGRDGLYAGGGAHLPWKQPGGRAFVDLRAGGYTAGGGALESKLVLPRSRARVRFDHLRSDGLALDARGAAGAADAGAAWDVDALRGARGLRATTDVDAAARPWDRGRVSTWLAGGDVTVDAGVRALAARGAALGGVDAAGATSALRLARGVGEVGVVDGVLEAGVLAPVGEASPGAPFASASSPSPASTRLARGALRGEVGGAFGPLTTRVAAGGAFASTAVDAAAAAPAGEAEAFDAPAHAVHARARVALPLGRAYGSAERPWLHRIEPYLAAAASDVHAGTRPELLPARGYGAIEGAAGLVESGLRTALGGEDGRSGLEATVAHAGVTTGAGGDGPRGALRGALAARTRFVGAGADAARVTDGDRVATALTARARLGRVDGANLRAALAVRGDGDARAARALVDPEGELPVAWLARPGTTAGAAGTLPFTRAFSFDGGADVDVDARRLVAARATGRLRDPCGCVELGLHGAHRLGRPGVDVWLTFDVRPR